MKSDRAITIIAVAIIAVILIGEVVVYTSNYTDYSSDVQLDGNTLEYSVSADGSKVYNVVVSDHVEDVGRVYIYYDPDYGSKIEEVTVAIGARELDQEYYISQLTAVLEFRHVSTQIIDAVEMADLMDDPTASIVCLSGALPCTVYTGNPTDKVFSWLNSGGRLYWAGNILGAYIGVEGGVEDAPATYQELFFEAECLNTSKDVDNAVDECDGNEYTHALSLVNNDVLYGVNPNMLPTQKVLPMGFVKEGYASLALVGIGDGMVCILGGDYSNNQRNDLAQIIATGLTPESQMISQTSGTVTRGTTSGEMTVSGVDLGAFVYLGGYYPVYAKNTVL